MAELLQEQNKVLTRVAIVSVTSAQVDSVCVMRVSCKFLMFIIQDLMPQIQNRCLSKCELKHYRIHDLELCTKFKEISLSSSRDSLQVQATF